MKRNKIFAILFGIACCNSFVLSQVVEYDNGDGVPRTIKEFAPNASEVCQIDSDTTFEVQGFLYITKKLCGIESNIAINCPNVQYSVRLGIINESKDNPFSLYVFDTFQEEKSNIRQQCSARVYPSFFQTPNELSFDGLGMFLRTNQYPKLKRIHQHIEKELENKPYILIPVSLKIDNVVLGYLTSVPYNFGLFDIKEILPLAEQEKQKILEQKCKIYRTNVTDVNKIHYCKGDMSDDKIYPFSKDWYVNMREEPNGQSRVVAKLASVAPKGEEYTSFIAGEGSLSDSNFPVFGFLFPVSKYETNIDIDDVNNLSWLVNRAKFLKDNLDVKIVKAQTISIMKNYGFVDNEQIELYTESLPKNGWYKVYFTDKKGKKIEGYIYKSQLSWGF
ncbi:MULTISPECIES: hypothetical protein [Helicobacter]|uniref:hypothetical protein n=1 Tax=Helicobacter TaxID=209 RepID=UPI0023F1B672|nr:MULTISPECIES: hypothetical protein [Helicobacter]